MAIVALHSAATGLSALSTQLDVTANNLANANTAGFKVSRTNFEDLMYLERAQPGVENANGDQAPAGLFVGLGTRVANTQLDFAQGNFMPTDRKLDWVIEGAGFFQVNTFGPDGATVGYTRSGNFFRNSEGDVVLGTKNGPRLEPPINIPDNIPLDRISVSATGQVSHVPPNAEQAEVLGEIQLANFVNPAGLEQRGGNIYFSTAASGPPIEGTPGEDTFGTIGQGYLEGSNVDPVKELVSLITTQRAFEMNSQSIQAADQLLQVVGNLRR